MALAVLLLAGWSGTGKSSVQVDSLVLLIGSLHFSLFTTGLYEFVLDFYLIFIPDKILVFFDSYFCL